MDLGFAEPFALSLALVLYLQQAHKADPELHKTMLTPGVGFHGQNWSSYTHKSVSAFLTGFLILVVSFRKEERPLVLYNC